MKSAIATQRVKFSQEEDTKLKELVKKHGQNWKLISSCMESRTPRQCRTRYQNYLTPGYFNGEWTKEEDQLLYDKYCIYGSHWKEIKKFFPSRTANAIKNRWNYYISKSGFSNSSASSLNNNDNSYNMNINPTSTQQQQTIHYQSSIIQPQQFTYDQQMQNYNNQNNINFQQQNHQRQNFFISSNFNAHAFVASNCAPQQVVTPPTYYQYVPTSGNFVI